MLRKLSSLQLDSLPKTLSTTKEPVLKPPKPRGNGPLTVDTDEDEDIEIVPDSEEERITARLSTYKVKGTVSTEVIEIPSDDDDDDEAPAHIAEKKSILGEVLDLEPMPGAWPNQKSNQTRTAKIKLYPARRVVVSDSESDEDTTKQLGLGSRDRTTRNVNEPSNKEAQPKSQLGTRTTATRIDVEEVLESEDDDPGTPDEEGAILVFENPPASRKPIPRPPRPDDLDALTPRQPSKTPRVVEPTTNHVSAPPEYDMFSPGFTRPGDPSRITIGNLTTTKHVDPNVLSLATDLQDLEDESEMTPTRTKSPRKPRAKKPPATPRVSKKALQEAEQAHREQYAQDLFRALNASVFDNKLPEETKLVWNKRMQTTAGRAKWHKSSQGIETTQIELATKVLDSEERIRNTLSHEMCHLASWVIDRRPKEAHGTIWRSWVQKVHRMHSHIHISTKHGYDIAYKYEWKCSNCDKIYGRHSKSIDHTACICGKCRVGDLIPQFPIRAPRTPKPKTTADSLMAAVQIRDSPSTVPSSSVRQSVTNSPRKQVRTLVNTDLDDLYESDSLSSDMQVSPRKPKSSNKNKVVYEVNTDTGSEMDKDGALDKIMRSIECIDLTSD